MSEPITPRLRPDVLLRPFEQYEGDNRFIVAVDDRHFVVSAAVAAVLEESRAFTTLAALAERASARLGMRVSPELAGRVLSEDILSVCFHATETRASAPCPIRLRQRMFGARLLKPWLAVASPLFSRSSAGVLLAFFVAIELLVASRAAEAAPYSLSGTQIVCAATLTALGVIVHELGHLAACARFGASHGGIGVGLYWCMPVFYAEVNGAWMLPRLQRAAVDIGGLYLQCGYVLALGAAYLGSGSPVVLEAIVWSHLLMLHTLNPVLKYDGYWLLTDLAGIPNLHTQIRENARKVWRFVTGVANANGSTALHQLPHRGELGLLAAFTLLATAYFAYVFIVLGNNIGRGIGESLHRWTVHDGAPYGLWHALGETALLVLFLVMAISMAFLFARSLHRIGKDPHA